MSVLIEKHVAFFRNFHHILTNDIVSSLDNGSVHNTSQSEHNKDKYS